MIGRSSLSFRMASAPNASAPKPGPFRVGLPCGRPPFRTVRKAGPRPRKSARPIACKGIYDFSFSHLTLLFMSNREGLLSILTAEHVSFAPSPAPATDSDQLGGPLRLESPVGWSQRRCSPRMVAPTPWTPANLIPTPTKTPACLSNGSDSGQNHGLF